MHLTDVGRSEFPSSLFQHGLRLCRHPLVLSMAGHLLVIGLLVVAPMFPLHHQSLEVQTVRLFTAVEAPSPPKPTAKPVSEPAPKPQPPSPPPVSLAPAPAQPTPAKPRKVVTLRPLKTKRRIRPSKAAVKAQQTMLERRRLQERVRRERQRAEAEARRKRLEALDAIRRAYRSSAAATATLSPPASSTAAKPPSGKEGAGDRRGDGDQVVSLAKKRYYAAILTHLSRFWTLPDTVEWPEDLEAVVVLWLRRDGTVSKRVFEKRSSSAPFNRFVEQTLDKAGAMPPFPQELPMESLEIGIRFRPHELL